MKELRPHQRKAVEELSNGKVLVGGVGTGKTLTALAYFYEKVLGGRLGDFGSIQNVTDLYVFTTARKRDDLDWQLEASRMGMSTDREASATGVKVTVDSYNNIQKYKDIHNAFIILDEQRMVGSGAWTKTFIHLAKSNRWIMLSATPGDKWEDYIPLFLANGFYRNRTEFTRSHLVFSYYGRYPKLERYLGEQKLNRLRNQITVEMPYERHTTRHMHDVPVEYDKELFKKVVKDRWHVYENRPLKDVSELFAVMRKVVNSDETRMRRLRELLSEHPRVIVFYNFDYELEILRKLTETRSSGSETLALRSTGKDGTTSENGQTPFTTKSSLTLSPENESSSTQVLTNDGMGQIQKDRTSGSPSQSTSIQIAEWNGHKHEPVPTSDRWVYLVQYAAGAEAWNCTSTDTIVFYSLTYSYRHFHQAQGRIDRLDTPFSHLHYYILKSKSFIDLGVARALDSKKDFNEREQGLYT